MVFPNMKETAGGKKTCFNPAWRKLQQEELLSFPQPGANYRREKDMIFPSMGETTTGSKTKKQPKQKNAVASYLPEEQPYV